MFHAQELGSYAQGQGSLAVFKVTARDQGHHKGPLGAFVTYCNISCFIKISYAVTGQRVCVCVCVCVCYVGYIFGLGYTTKMAPSLLWLSQI